MKKNIILILIIALMIMPVFAQDAEAEIEDDGAASLGMYFCAGEFSMIGLHYQQWFGNHGIMVSGGLTGDVFCAVAVYEYCVYSAKFTDILNSRLYLWILGGVDCVNEHNYISSTETYEDDFYVNAVGSLGVGIEFVWWKHLSIPVQFGYVIEAPHKTKMSFSFASGIRYRF